MTSLLLTPPLLTVLSFPLVLPGIGHLLSPQRTRCSPALFSGTGLQRVLLNLPLAFLHAWQLFYFGEPKLRPCLGNSIYRASPRAPGPPPRFFIHQPKSVLKDGILLCDLRQTILPGRGPDFSPIKWNSIRLITPTSLFSNMAVDKRIRMQGVWEAGGGEGRQGVDFCSNGDLLLAQDHFPLLVSASPLS